MKLIEKISDMIEDADKYAQCALIGLNDFRYLNQYRAAVGV